MKKLLFFFGVLVFFTSCEQAGVTTSELRDDSKLPEHLKGDGKYIYIATIPGKKTTSLQCREGKTHENVIVVEIDGRRYLNCESIIFENDSIICVKK